MNVLIKFRHGLGDAVQLTLVLQHLKHYHPDWEIDVAALVGKHSAFHGLCRNVFILDRDEIPRSGYQRVFDLDWPECPTCYADWPGTKAERCLLDVFRVKPIPERFHYVINRSQRAIQLARGYLENVCKVSAEGNGRYPVVLVHYEGNTSAEQKNLSVETVRQLYDEIIGGGLIPVILDWDYRTPLVDGKRIHNPHVDLDLWGGSPWLYSTDGGSTSVEFCTRNQENTVAANGDATLKKNAEGPHQNNHSDPDQDLGTISNPCECP